MDAAGSGATRGARGEMADDGLLTMSQVSGATTTAGWHDPSMDLSDAPPALADDGGNGGGSAGGGVPDRALSRSRLDEGKLTWMLRRFPTPEGMDAGAWEAILKHTISPRRWIDVRSRSCCAPAAPPPRSPARSY